MLISLHFSPIHWCYAGIGQKPLLHKEVWTVGVGEGDGCDIIPLSYYNRQTEIQFVFRKGKQFLCDFIFLQNEDGSWSYGVKFGWTNADTPVGFSFVYHDKEWELFKHMEHLSSYNKNLGASVSCFAWISYLLYTFYLKSANNFSERQRALVAANEGGGGKPEHLVQVTLSEPIQTCREYTGMREGHINKHRHAGMDGCQLNVRSICKCVEKVNV